MSNTQTSTLSAQFAYGRPQENRLIHIEVSGLIAADGATMEPFSSYYSTHFSPMYTTVSFVRIIGRQFIADVPDDTINQLIHFFSILAENLIGARIIDPIMLDICLARWIASMVVITLIDGTPINAKMTKRLADLMVARDGAAKALSDRLHDDIPDLEECLLLGGSDNSGIGLKTPIKGEWHPESMVAGRQWVGDQNSNVVPGANSRVGVSRDGIQLRKPRRTWVDPTWRR